MENTTYQKKTWSANDIVTADDLNNIENGISTNMQDIANIEDNYLTKTEASNTYLTKTDASSTYLKKTDASSTYLTQSNASMTYLTKSDASNTYLTQSNASVTYLTKTEAGSTYAKASSLTDNELKKTLLRLLYPVGSILMTANNNNPQSYIGGTWVAWGSGRVPVGVDSSQSEFNSPEKTGGEKYHTLTIDEIPTHDHKGQSVLSTAKGYNPPIGGQIATSNVPLGSSYRKVQYSYQEPKLGTGTFALSVNHYIQAEYGVPANGGGSAHTNLQPYITCYMWKRTY